MIRKSIFAPVNLLLLVFILWTFLPASAAVLEDIMSKGELVVSTDANYAPQSFISDRGELDGFDVDVAKEVAKRMGVKIKFVTPDWDLIVAGRWGGMWDLNIGSMIITDAKAEVVDFSSPYYYTPAQFCVHKENTTIKTLDDFSGRTVGLGSGTTYETYLDPDQELRLGGGEKVVHQVQKVKVRTYTTGMEAIHNLVLGDGLWIDGVLTSGFLIQEAIKNGIPIKSIGEPVFFEPLAAASDKARAGSAELVKKVSEIIESMHEDKTLSKLSMKWYGFDVTRKRPEPKPSKPVWNLWPEEGYTSQPNLEPISYLKPATEYIFVVHLSAMPYYKIPKTKLSSAPFNRALNKYLLKTHRRSLKAKVVILADPGYIKILGRNDRDFNISLENIREWPPEKTFQENVEHLKILKEDPDAKFKYGGFFFRIKTTKREGKAPIGISVWVKGRPVEEITTKLCIAKNKETADKLLRDKSSTYYGLKGFEMFRPELRDLPLPAAAIHFLEIGEYGNRSVYGILRVNQGKYKNTEENPFDSWEVTTESSLKLRENLKAFSKNFRSGKMHNQEIVQHGHGLFKILFPDKNGLDANKGRNRFISFFKEEAKNLNPFQRSNLLTILIRTVLQDFDYLLNVPLGMMAVHGSRDENSLLGYHFNVETPLEYQSFEENIECISKWTMILPPSKSNDAELEAVRKNFSEHFSKWEEASKKYKRHYDSMKNFADWITTKSERLEPPSILSIVSHHSNRGKSIHLLKNTEDWPLAAYEMEREFDSPSVVILNGCGTATPGSEEFVRSFNKLGFETVIATNTTVSGKMAAHFMNCFAKQIEENSKDSSFTVADAYYRALSCLYYGDKSATKNSNYGAQVLFYSILGDPNIRLCPPKE